MRAEPAEVVKTACAEGITLTVDAEHIKAQPASKLTPALREWIKTHKSELLAYLTKDAANMTVDPSETRRREVLSMLAGNPDITYAFTSDDQIDPDYVIITLAIRDQATCDLRIPKARYDGFTVLRVIEQYTQH